MYKEIHFSDHARNGLAKGVQKLTDAVKVTMGPRGRNVLIQKTYGAPVLTKDGVSVATEITLKDPLENMGAQLVKEVSSNVADEAGDGTTTATVLANAIFSEGLKSITSGANPVEVKRGMDKACTAILDELKKTSREIDSTKEIAQVATISANSDSDIGDMIAEAMDKVGQDGVITVEEAKGIIDELEVVEGMQFDRGYLSPYFVTNPDKMTVELDSPYILFYDSKLLSLNDLIVVLEQVQKTNRPLLLIVEDVEAEALNTLVVNKMRGILNVSVVKAPAFGDRRKAILEDMAISTNGTLISEEIGRKLNSTVLEDLGECVKIIIDKDSTTIINGAGSKEAIQERVSELKNAKEEADIDYDKEKLQERIAKLGSGVAVIKVGAATETEMKEKRDRVDDALGATKAAVEEGIIIGGGAAFVKIIKKIDLDLEGDQEIGCKIVLKAITAPLRQIVMNAGIDAGIVVHRVMNDKDDTIGFNAANGEYVDMFEAGIIDPLKVARVALTNAISVSSMLLTTEAVIQINDDGDINS